MTPPNIITFEGKKYKRITNPNCVLNSKYVVCFEGSKEYTYDWVMGLSGDTVEYAESLGYSCYEECKQEYTIEDYC
jgi:hypothetical protein